DSMDFHKPIFENFIDTVILKDITFEDNTFKLIGPYVNITDRSPFFIAPATSTDGDFFFTRDQSGFEDVMAYYHIDSMQRYVQKLGFINLQNGPMQVDPHGKSDLDQSVFIGNGGNSYILFGDGGVDDAEDADVLVHEYAHALSYDAAPETNSGTERRGLDEGIGDYSSAIYSFDSDSVYGWDKIFNWDGHNEFWSGRKAISHIQYPPSSTSIYTYGEIWASALMEIRQELGKEVADRLAIQEMYGNFAQMTLTDAAMLYLDAEMALYGGIHSEMISFTFCEKGILSGPDCINVTLEEELDSEPSLSIFPVPAEDQLTLSWSLPLSSSTARLEMVNLLGQTVFHLPLPDFEGELSFAPNLSSGLYIALLIIDEKRTTRQKIQIK
ncbi:MAG: hypothetical protein KDD63_27850, partial [Bacteroidetes bacterium]|nr:hypothetical protein [Bacteroidota bacterium]